MSNFNSNTASSDTGRGGGGGGRRYTPREFCQAHSAGALSGGKSVFLAGTTTSTSIHHKWRGENHDSGASKALIAKGINVIDPLDPQWAPECLVFEREALKAADSILCLLSEDALGIVSLMELVANREKAEIVIVHKEMRHLYYGDPKGGMKEASAAINQARQAIPAYIPHATIIEVKPHEDLMDVLLAAIEKHFS